MILGDSINPCWGGISDALDREACNKLEKLHDLYFRPSIQHHDFSHRESKRKVDISEDDEHPSQKAKKKRAYPLPKHRPLDGLMVQPIQRKAHPIDMHNELFKNPS